MGSLVVSLWTLTLGATYPLTHQFRGGDGSVLQEYPRLPTDLLFDSNAIIDRLENASGRQLEADGDGESQQPLDGSAGCPARTGA